MRVHLGTILLGLMLLSCSSTTAGVDSQQVGPSPIILGDTSPSQLSVSVLINMGGYDAASRDRSTLDMFFQHAGRPVEFVAGEHVDCAGHALTRFRGGTFEVEVNSASIGGREVDCSYRWGAGGQKAELKMLVPPMLEILSPVDHEHLTRGPNTLVRYTGVLATDIWVVALSPSAKAVSDPKDATLTQVVLNTSALDTGEGSINLTDPNNILVEIHAPAFASVTASARRTTAVDVMWI